VTAALAVVASDYERAASVLAEIGCRPDEAYVHLRAGEALVRAGRGNEAAPHVEAALAFYRSVGAARFVREAEALRAAMASDPRRSASAG
jgi:hypothetical protein